MIVTIPASEVVAKTILAKCLYTKYCEAVGGKAYNGDVLPTWEEFASDPKKKLQADAWVATAESAISEISASFSIVVTHINGLNFSAKDSVPDTQK